MKLSSYMELRSLNDRAMADLIGDCQETAVRKWRLGERIPRPRAMRRILEVTEGGVTPADFILPPRVAA
jgi:DNA-binding transcriptional regulator YdaS (Cro superfamily)